MHCTTMPPPKHIISLKLLCCVPLDIDQLLSYTFVRLHFFSAFSSTSICFSPTNSIFSPYSGQPSPHPPESNVRSHRCSQPPAPVDTELPSQANSCLSIQTFSTPCPMQGCAAPKPFYGQSGNYTSSYIVFGPWGQSNSTVTWGEHANSTYTELRW